MKCGYNKKTLNTISIENMNTKINKNKKILNLNNKMCIIFKHFIFLMYLFFSWRLSGWLRDL